MIVVGGMKLSKLSTIGKSTMQDAIKGMLNKMGKAFILLPARASEQGNVIGSDVYKLSELGI